MATYRIFDINRARKDFFTFFDDFNAFTAANWTITRVGTTPTEAVQNANGGRLLVTTSAASGDRDAVQYAGAAGATRTEFALTVGKKLQVATRFQLGNALNPAVVLGLHSVQTDPVGTPPTDGIFFRKDAASARIWAVLRKAGVETKLDTQTDLVANTDYDCEMYYDGSHSTIGVFINQVKVGSLPVAAAPASASLLSVSFAIQNGTAAANTLNLDVLSAQVQR